MESVINGQYIKSYAEKYADQITQIFFENKAKIRGEEILALTNIKQVNLFIVKKLMDYWKKEADKLKSPYFNYEDKEVKSRFQELMNTLSKNIWIEKKHFEPLLVAAVIDTLYLIFSPYEFFLQELSDTKSSISKQHLINKKRFIKINGELFEAFLNKIKLSEKEAFIPDETRSLFNKVCEEINFEPEDPDPYVDKFSQVEPFYLQKVYHESNEETQGKKTNPSEKGSDQSVLSQYEDPKNTLVQELETDSSNTVLDFHHKQKIDSIRKNISIHQKFMFLKELFQNSDEEFNQVIDFLDQCASRNEAMEYLENNYFNPRIWNDENEAVIDFMSVIDKKFL